MLVILTINQPNSPMIEYRDHFQYLKISEDLCQVICMKTYKILFCFVPLNWIKMKTLFKTYTHDAFTPKVD